MWVKREQYEALKKEAAELKGKLHAEVWSAKRDADQRVARLAADVVEVFGLTDKYVYDDSNIDTSKFMDDLKVAIEYLEDTSKRKQGEGAVSWFRRMNA